MRLAEVTVLVSDLKAAAQAWATASGLVADLSEAEGRMAVDDVVIRLVGPADPETAGLIEGRGEGLFELTIEVEDLAATTAGLRANNVEVSDIVTGESGRLETRIDPAASHGALIRLVEKR
jgi:hypothetical protein